MHAARLYNITRVYIAPRTRDDAATVYIRNSGSTVAPKIEHGKQQKPMHPSATVASKQRSCPGTRQRHRGLLHSSSHI